MSNPHNYETSWTIEQHRDELIERLGEAIRQLAQQAATIGKLTALLTYYRLEHSRDNCYFSGPTGAICDECVKVDELLAKLPKEMP